ncbi:MAG: cold shock domain-containing protein [Gammaproteobacteria bacterium]|nr:cold shock domain-containing protein [Gammaproteobacteria bacterium]
MAAPSKNKKRLQTPMQRGVLVMWNDQKGFGFIRPQGTEDDYFVHISTFKKGLTRRPEIGDDVHFRAG